MGSSTDKKIITMMGEIMDKLDSIEKRIAQIEAAPKAGLIAEKPKKPKKKRVPKPESDANESILFHWVKKDGSKGSDANYLNISNHTEFKTFLKGLNLKWRVHVRSTDPNIKGGWELPKDLTVSKLRAEIAEAWPEWSFEDTRFHNRSARVICRFFRQMRLRQLSILSKSHRDFYTSSPTDVLCEIRGFI